MLCGWWVDGVWNSHRAVMKIRCWWRNIRYNNQYKYNKSCRWNRIIYFVHGEFFPKKEKKMKFCFFGNIVWLYPYRCIVSSSSSYPFTSQEYQQLVQWSLSGILCRESPFLCWAVYWLSGPKIPFERFAMLWQRCWSAQSPKGRHENHYTTSKHKHFARAHPNPAPPSPPHHVMV